VESLNREQGVARAGGEEIQAKDEVEGEANEEEDDDAR